MEKETDRCCVREMAAEFQQVIAEFREKIDTQENPPLPGETPREEVGPENKQPRISNEQETTQPTAVTQMTTEPASTGKPVSPAHKEKRERSGWLVPLLCALVVLASVGLIVLSVRKKNA